MKKAGSEERPALSAVLDHYDVPFNAMRIEQMVKCPLHEDRTPSCSINLREELWKCHSCGEGGDAYTMIMKKEGVDFVRARAVAATLASSTGSAGRGDQELRGSAYGGRRKVPARKGDQPRGSSFRPSWRRD